MSQTELITELGKMRRSLKPILSAKYNRILEEVEDVLKGDAIKSIPSFKKKEPTYDQLVSKYYFRNKA